MKNGLGWLTLAVLLAVPAVAQEGEGAGNAPAKKAERMQEQGERMQKRGEKLERQGERREERGTMRFFEPWGERVPGELSICRDSLHARDRIRTRSTYL